MADEQQGQYSASDAMRQQTNPIAAQDGQLKHDAPEQLSLPGGEFERAETAPLLRQREEQIRHDADSSDAQKIDAKDARKTAEWSDDQAITTSLSPDDAPERLKKRYLLTQASDLLAIGKQTHYHFKDGANQVAFKDGGNKLSTLINDTEVVRSMVDLAKAKHWTLVQVSGHADFKREAWLHARLNQLKVSGYRPTALDLAKLVALQQLAAPKRADQTATANPPGTPLAPATQAKAAEAGHASHDPLPRENKSHTREISGTLVAYGPARYQHDEQSPLSFYVTTRNASGTEKTTWGVDLERAIKASGAQVGDTVTLGHKGQRMVTLHQALRDSSGQVTGHHDLQARRNSWEVTKLEANLSVIEQEMSQRGYSRSTIDRTKAQAQSKMHSMLQQGKPIPSLRKYDKAAPALYRPPQERQAPHSPQRTVRR